MKRLCKRAIREAGRITEEDWMLPDSALRCSAIKVDQRNQVKLSVFSLHVGFAQIPYLAKALKEKLAIFMYKLARFQIKHIIVGRKKTKSKCNKEVKVSPSHAK